MSLGRGNRLDLLRKLKGKKGRKGLIGVGEEHEGTERLSWGRNRERESQESNILIEGVIMVLGRNVMIGKSPGIHKDYTS